MLTLASGFVQDRGSVKIWPFIGVCMAHLGRTETFVQQLSPLPMAPLRNYVARMDQMLCADPEQKGFDPKMRADPVRQPNRDRLFRLTFAAAVCLVVAKAVVFGLGLHANFATMGNDDIMRLTVVRDLIAGQSWFDITQYRMVPPEGLSLHWSRYIDAGIAAVILPLSLFFEMDLAEQIAAAVWPTLIMLLILGVVGLGTRHVFGPTAAIFAVLCLVVWPLTADLHVRPGNLDHHNVQFLMMVVMVFAVIWPQGATRTGLVAGLAAAFSLAVGLESVLFIVVAGIVLVVAAASGAGRQRLVAFCGALVSGSVLLWLGQAPPATRLVPVCDQLGTPILALVGVSAIAGLLPVMALRGAVRPVMTLAATAALTLVGLLVVWPLLGPCLQGPYGNLPETLQLHIATRIVETKPAFVYARTDPVSAIIYLLPVLAALLLGGQRWFNARTAPLGVLMVFLLAGLGMVFYQMRTVIMAATVVPVIGGVVMAQMLASYLKERSARRGLLMLVVLVAFIAPTLIVTGLQPLLPRSSQAEGPVAGDCRSYASLQSLNQVPPGLILSHGNLGASLIWATHHDALSAPYHRSAAAMGNGIYPFAMDSAEMAAYVRATGATHLLLCRDHTYDGAFATSLAAGAQADWLEVVPLEEDTAQMLFAVLPE